MDGIVGNEPEEESSKLGSLETWRQVKNESHLVIVGQYLRNISR